MVKVSIVIPVYNGEKYLAECIESCLNQTYKDYEIIIINDGSKDKTESILTGYAREHKDKITVYHKHNGGTASALNVGLESMKGDWFKWLSADDVLLSTALEDMMTQISMIPQHQQYIFYTNYSIINEQGKIISEFVEPDRTKHTRDLRNAELLHNFYGNGSTTMIHKNLFHIVGKFHEGLDYDEDLEFWLRACIKFKMTLYHLDLITLKYRTHSDSLTSTKNPDEDYELLQSIRKKYLPYITDEQKTYLSMLNSKTKLKRKIIRKLPKPLRNIIWRSYKAVR
jgi:glycosyltransferase involved in cell wall biosynthesis